jgi:tRNA1Val (adenine37-N6)-methyltransferase
MSEHLFQFKKFSVRQNQCAMKVGTDAVLLGAWTQPGLAKAILDIGTGTGILSLMLAQRSQATITAIDIDQGAFLQAKENFEASAWSDRIHLDRISVQDYAHFTSKKFDLIITNPPYFNSESKPVNESRSIARHNDPLPFSDLISSVLKLLEPEGKLYIILPNIEGLLFLNLAQQNGLFCHSLLRIRTKQGRPEKRWLMKFGRSIQPIDDQLMVLQKDEHHYTDEYVAMTKAYYLKS